MKSSWKASSMPKCKRISTAAFLAFVAGCAAFSQRVELPKAQLVASIVDAGGRFDSRARQRPSKIDTVYLPKDSLNRLRPSMLTEFPNLRAVMIIEDRDGEEVQLTGCLVDDRDDLLALEEAYKQVGWIH